MESKSIFSIDFYSLREKDIKNGENKEDQGIVRNGLDLFRSDALPLFVKEEPVILFQRSERLGMNEKEITIALTRIASFELHLKGLFFPVLTLYSVTIGV